MSMTHICCFHFMPCSAHLNHAWNQPLKFYPGVSIQCCTRRRYSWRNSIIPATKRSFSLFKNKLQRSSLLCWGWRLKKKAAICISAPIANKILFLRDNDCRIRSLKNNGSLRELAQNMMPFQGTNLKPGITVSDMRSNSSNRNNDVNNNAARLASSSWLHELCITIR